MKLYLTDKGRELLYKVQGGKQLKFIRFGLGDGSLNGQAIQSLVNLMSQKLSASLSKCDVKNNKVILGMSFTNSSLVEGFYFRELGVFAEDPDTKEEILYMYANAGDAADYIDSNTGRVIEENLDVELYISNVENISATIDGSLVYASYKELEEVRKEVDGIVVPTKVSELENDSNYIKEDELGLLAKKNLVSKLELTEELTAEIANKATTKMFQTVLLADNWEGSGPYTQNLIIEGILSTDTPIVDVILSDTTEVAQSQLEVWSYINKIITLDNLINVVCYEDKPSVDLTIQMKVVR